MNQSIANSSCWNLSVAGRHPLTAALLGAVLLCGTFPPTGWALLGWIALAPWLALIAVAEFQSSKPWLNIWLGGLVFWAAQVYYVTIPHWLLWFGWVLLFLYLSIYPLLFVWLGRILVHDHRIPLIVAGPVVFTALEWVRAHLISGFGFSMLSNSQYQWPIAIQISDLAGAYGLTFLMVMVNVGLLYLLSDFRTRWRSVLAGAVALLMVAGYGMARWNQLKHRVDNAESADNTLNVEVVQGSIDTRFPASREEQQAYAREQFQQYLTLQRQYDERNGSGSPTRFAADLIVWPEGKYPVPDMLPGSAGPEVDRIRSEFGIFHEIVFEGYSGTPPPMIVGALSIDSAADDVYNAALLLDSNGLVRDRYFKIHRVLFGEYVPLQEWFPILDRLTPIGKGLTPGRQPKSFEIAGFRLAPNICFESAVTHQIRDSVNELDSLGREPDVLVNLTDDGWFYGTAALDHHLACNVMRAVENRKPVVVAANTGFSALIDASGRVRQQGPRRQTAVLELTVPVFATSSLYRTVGDWPAAILTISCVIGIITRRRGRGWKARHQAAAH